MRKLKSSKALDVYSVHVSRRFGHIYSEFAQNCIEAIDDMYGYMENDIRADIMACKTLEYMSILFEDAVKDCIACREVF